MHLHAPILSRDSRTGAWTLLALALGVGGCAPRFDGPAPAVMESETAGVAGTAAAGSAPTGVVLLYVYENTRSAPYYPLEGVSGVAWSADGTLILCDEKRGRVHACEAISGEWYHFDAGPEAPFRPVDVRVDGFSVLILDMGSRLLLRYDLGGAYQDRLINFQQIDATRDRLPSAFDVDLDGRLVCADAAQEQLLLLDSFLNLQQTIGGPGTHREQFDEPSGIAFLNDGGFVVADRGNRRLQWYSRLGYFEGVVGGEFDTHNPLLTPQGLDTDASGNLFVADPAAGAVHVFDAGLGLQFTAGSELGLLAAPLIPVDVAVGPDDLLAVSDRGRQAVLVYRILYE